MLASPSKSGPVSRRGRRLGGDVLTIPAKRLEKGISAEIPDWNRERKSTFSWVPSRSLIAAFRSYERVNGRAGPVAALRRKIAVLRYRFWSTLTGADIPLGTKISGGLMLPHPNGIVIHPAARIGPNCMIMHQVTLGGGRTGAPQVGGHVDIGAGAKILGGVTIGDHAMIGANALVIHDVPAGAVVMAPLAEIRTAGGQTGTSHGGNSDRADPDSNGS